MDDMDIDNVIEVPDTRDRVAVQNINRRDCIRKGNYSSISSRLDISGFSDEELKMQPWKNKDKVATERGRLRTSVRHRSSLYISDNVEIHEKSRIPALEKEVPKNILRLPRKPEDNNVIYEGKPYTHPQLTEKGKAPSSSSHSLMSSLKGHGAVLDSSKQNGNSKARTKIIWKNSRSEECREGRLVDNFASSHFVENSSAVDSKTCRFKEKLVDTEDIGSTLDRGKGFELVAESQPYPGRPGPPSFHLSNSHRPNSKKRLVRNGCISPHNVEKAKQSVQKHISSLANPEHMDTEIRELIAESSDSRKFKGKGLLTRDFLSKQSDAKTMPLLSRNLIRSGKDDGMNHANEDSSECSEGLGGWISMHNRTRKLNPQISDADVIVSSRKDDPFKLNEPNRNVSGSPIVQSTSRFKHQVGRLDEHRNAANTILKRQKQHSTGGHQGESSSSAFNNCEVVVLGSSGEPSNVRSASTTANQKARSSNSVIEIDEFSPEIRNGGSHKVDGNSNIDSDVRARQLEADEILARELQEQLYNEVPAIGVREMDEHIALALQQERSSHPTSSGSHRLPPPQLMRDLVRQTHSQSSQNPPTRRATRARVPTSTRMPRSRARFPGQPRTISSNQRDSLFHPDVDVDTRIHLLEALEAFSDMGMAGGLLTQHDFNENDYEMLLALDENNHHHGGASAAQINGLPQSTVQSDNLEDCSICLEAPSAGDTIRHLPCLHRFHKDCIDQWLSRKSSCPVCKSSIT